MRIRAFMSGKEGSPTVYVPMHEDISEELWSQLRKEGANLVTLSGLDWENDLSPWESGKAFKGGRDFSGGANAFLERLRTEAIPYAENIFGSGERIIAGYSLAGLFAIYSILETGLFSAAVSASGSMWFPSFDKYVEESEADVNGKRAYLSVGRKEKMTKNPLLCTVEDKMLSVASSLEEKGMSVFTEINEGGHMDAEAERLLTGIKWALP